MKVLTNIEEVGPHQRALSELDALGDQDNSAWACIHRVVEITDQHWNLEESTNGDDLDAAENWNWEEHHYGVEYRSAWSSQPVMEDGAYTPHHWLVSDAGVEARIILAGGGPAVRIVAELDGYGFSDKFIVEHANWSPWDQIDLLRDDRLSDGVREYVFSMVGRYIQHVAGRIQQF